MLYICVCVCVCVCPKTKQYVEVTYKLMKAVINLEKLCRNSNRRSKHLRKFLSHTHIYNMERERERDVVCLFGIADQLTTTLQALQQVYNCMSLNMHIYILFWSNSNTPFKRNKFNQIIY